jgi:hypothetical protein
VLKNDVLLLPLSFLFGGKVGAKAGASGACVHVPRPIGFVLGHIWVMKSWFIIT